MALGRNGRAGAEAPDEHTEGRRGIAAIRHDPERQGGEKRQQARRHRQFMRLSGGEREADGPSGPIGDDAGLGGKAAAGSANSLTLVSLRGRAPFLAAPAAFWWARIVVPSRNTMPSLTPS
jgi:hypothetical protein